MTSDVQSHAVNLFSGFTQEKSFWSAVFLTKGRNKMADGASLTTAAATGDEKVCYVQTVLSLYLAVMKAIISIIFSHKSSIFKLSCCDLFSQWRRFWTRVLMQTRVHQKGLDPSVLQRSGVTIVLCSCCWIEGKQRVLFSRLRFNFSEHYVLKFRANLNREKQ